MGRPLAIFMVGKARCKLAKQTPEVITMVIDNETLDKYSEAYFTLHPRAHVRPIKQPFHESINQWMIMKRPMMNGLKQKWKDFICWFVNEQGYSNLRIKRCEIAQKIYYETNRRHDLDNGVPKFILDGLVQSGMIDDDDSEHISKITLECATDHDNPRTVLNITIYEYAAPDEELPPWKIKEMKENKDGGKNLH